MRELTEVQVDMEEMVTAVATTTITVTMATPCLAAATTWIVMGLTHMDTVTATTAAPTITTAMEGMAITAMEGTTTTMAWVVMEIPMATEIPMAEDTTTTCTVVMIEDTTITMTKEIWDWKLTDFHRSMNSIKNKIMSVALVDMVEIPITTVEMIIMVLVMDDTAIMATTTATALVDGTTMMATTATAMGMDTAEEIATGSTATVLEMGTVAEETATPTIDKDFACRMPKTYILKELLLLLGSFCFVSTDYT
jgi:hypothetical protein